MKKINFLQMALLSTLSYTMIANASTRKVTMHNHTSHPLYYSVQCDAGLANSAGAAYSVAPRAEFTDSLHTVEGEEHDPHKAVCHIAIAPKPDAAAYIKVEGSPHRNHGWHCKVTNTPYLGKKVKCHIRQSRSVLIKSSLGKKAIPLHLTVTEK